MRHVSLSQRARRVLAWGLITLTLLVVSGLLLADRLAPRADGVPSHALPVAADATLLDREIAPLVERNGGRTGAILVSDGLDAFAARALSARRAGRSLDLMYYIWHDDLTGRLLGREVWLAAERGVRVRLLLDDINAAGKDTALLALDTHPNIEVRLYNPLRQRSGLGRIKEMVQRMSRLNHRMHNKAWIADARMAVVGGRNIGTEYFNASDASNFHDLDLVLFGPAVDQASAIFDAYWNSKAAVPMTSLSHAGPRELEALVKRVRAESDEVQAQRYLSRVAQSRNVRDYSRKALQPHWIEQLTVSADPPLKQPTLRDAGLAAKIVDDLSQAKRKALLISPYFVPGEGATEGLVRLAGKGVQTAVITNSLAANDVAAVHGGYSRYRTALLAGGVQLHEIRAQPSDTRPRMGTSSGASLHTKAYLLDDRRGFIGSFNMDPRSANLNTEMGVFFNDPGLAQALRAEYLHLASPALSYWVFLDHGGHVRWLDRETIPPKISTREPGASAWRRAQAMVFRWLPLESQL